MIKGPLLAWWARAKIGGGVLGWRGRCDARGKAQLRKEAEAALRAVMAAEQRLLDLVALAAALMHARGAGAAGALLSEAQELLDTVDALRHTCAAALRVAMRSVRVKAEVLQPEAEAARGNAVGIDLEALRVAVDAAQTAGIDTELIAAGAALLVGEETRQAQRAAEMRERLEEAARAAAARTRAAATIQSPVRGRAARQRCGEVRAAAARQLAAVARIQAAARGGARRRPYSAMRAAALLLQAAARRYAVRVLANELLLDLRLLRNGHVFIKFSQDNGRPHDRLVQLQAEL